MGKSEKFSQIIQSFIQAAQESKGQITRKEGNLGGIEYEFIGRRKEGTKKLDSFSIIFKETKMYFIQYNISIIYSYSDKITDAEQDDSSDPRIRWKLSKTKRMFSARNLKSTQTALGENAVTFYFLYFLMLKRILTL